MSRNLQPLTSLLIVLVLVALPACRSKLPVNNSVVTVGYGPMRTGSTSVQTLPSAYKKQAAPELENAGKSMPLLVDNRDGSVFGFGKSRYLIFTFQDQVKAFDIEAKKIEWSIRPQGGLQNFFFGSGTVDLENGTIYFIVSKYKRSKEGLERQRSFSVLEIQEFGKRFKETKIPLPKLLGQEHIQHLIEDRVRCKTSLVLRKSDQIRQIVYGCSLRPDHNHPYGASKGLTGAVVALNLDSGGSVVPGSASVFIPSKVDENEVHSGYDTGIYNSGSGPSILPDGSVMVATGNGPFLPNASSYGCSLVRLEGKNLNIARSSQNEAQVYSLEMGGYNECWSRNVEFASSAVAMINVGDKTWAAATHKAGYLAVFDPYKLHDKSLVQVQKISEPRIYGQPALVMREGELWLAVLGKGKPSRWIDFYIADEDWLESNPKENSKRCIGVVLKEARPKSEELSLFFSGRLREDYLALPSRSRMAIEIQSLRSPLWGTANNLHTSKHLWAAYKKEATIGFIPKSLTNEERKSLRFKRFEVVRQWDEVHSAVEKPQEATSQERRLGSFRMVEGKAGGCPLEVPKGWKRIFQFESWRHNIGPDRDFVWIGSSVRGDGVKLRHKYVFPEGWEWNRSNPMILRDLDKKKAYAVVAANKKGVGKESTLFFVDLDEGESIFTLKFDGTMHFSMPLISGKDLFLATKENGIQWFQGVGD